MKYKNQWEYILKKNKPESSETSRKENSNTVPGQASSLRNILERAVRGQPVNVRQTYYEDLPHEIDLSRLREKPVDITDYEEGIEDELENLMSMQKKDKEAKKLKDEEDKRRADDEERRKKAEKNLDGSSE